MYALLHMRELTFVLVHLTNSNGSTLLLMKLTNSKIKIQKLLLHQERLIPGIDSC